MALIINELVTNSIKHGFPDNGGDIQVEIKEMDGKYQLIVSDNGVGMGEITQGLGLSLINALTEQINGDLQINTNGVPRPS